MAITLALLGGSAPQRRTNRVPGAAGWDPIPGGAAMGMGACACGCAGACVCCGRQATCMNTPSLTSSRCWPSTHGWPHSPHTGGGGSAARAFFGSACPPFGSWDGAARLACGTTDGGDGSPVATGAVATAGRQARWK